MEEVSSIQEQLTQMKWDNLKEELKKFFNSDTFNIATRDLVGEKVYKMGKLLAEALDE